MSRAALLWRRDGGTLHEMTCGHFRTVWNHSRRGLAQRPIVMFCVECDDIKTVTETIEITKDDA